MMNTIKQLRTLTLIWFCELLRINIGTTAGFMFLIFIHVYAYSTVTSVFTVLLILMYFSFVILLSYRYFKNVSGISNNNLI